VVAGSAVLVLLIALLVVIPRTARGRL